ncbi:hypothetical protein [Novosphingobium sp. JCM 18896]|uniref:hypothetical protein n=1 Tax=Novosphingobium sp. JCM 18896 TaxID=2989731 RepID=UPI002222F6A9|nr:hypothetical protein [Novosphingobium sp. JCM 18896]MCW1430832.1 hypothetical protein [Novosphingobium sp. JCM 18896]
MLKFQEAAVHVIGGDIRTTLDTMDQAFASHLRLAAEAVEAMRGSGMPVAQSQRLMTMLHEGHSAGLAWRQKMQTSIGLMQAFHRRSNQAETGAGCPEGWDDIGFFTSGSIAEAEAPEAAMVEAP